MALKSLFPSPLAPSSSRVHAGSLPAADELIDLKGIVFELCLSPFEDAVGSEELSEGLSELVFLFNLICIH